VITKLNNLFAFTLSSVEYPIFHTKHKLFSSLKKHAILLFRWRSNIRCCGKAWNV